jgi:hypothetical protein
LSWREEPFTSPSSVFCGPASPLRGS